MKLLLLQGGFGAGGAEKIMAMLAAHRHGLGDAVTVAAMAMPPQGSFFPYPAGVDLRVLAPRAVPGPLRHLRRMLAIRRLIAEIRPDLVISFLTKINCLTLLAAGRLPVVISERNNPAMQTDRFWRRLQVRLAHRAKAIVMQTRAARADLPDDLQPRAVVISNPCAPVLFARAPIGPECRFVAVGRLDRQKGFDMLVDAFWQMPDSVRASLTIFGEGPERAALTERIAARGLSARITLPGLASGPAEWLAVGDALVLSSRYEGFPNVVAEAACSGLPVLAFDCPYGPSEMIQPDLNGILVPPGDVAGLSRAMARLAFDAALRVGLAAHGDWLAARLDPAQVLAEWDRVIQPSMSSS